MNTDARSEPPVGASGDRDESHNSAPQDAQESSAGERDAAGDKDLLLVN